MSTTPTFTTAPVSDPNFPNPPALASVSFANVFTAAELDFIQSVLWNYEEYNPTARIDVEQVTILTSVRAKLGLLVPTV